MEIIRRETDYAIRALLYLAANDNEEKSCSEISRECDIPKSFTHKILKKMAREGIVNSRIGRSGGSRLGKHPGDITLFDVINIIQGDVCISKCVVDLDACKRSKECPVQDEWTKLQGDIVAFLKKTTLDDI